VAATDVDLVRGTLGGSQQAFEELVGRYERAVFALVLRVVRDRGRAEELAQDTFVRAFVRLHTYDQQRAFSTWLLAIARNAAVDELRRIGADLASRAELESSDLALGSRAGPMHAAEHAELARALDEAISRLRPEYRELVSMRYEAELAYDEIAEATGLPVGTVKSYLHRARRELAAHLTEAGWGAGTAATSERPART
jgi:RNA polymerase sigma-70 factor (ECF subfamily)